MNCCYTTASRTHPAGQGQQCSRHCFPGPQRALAVKSPAASRVQTASLVRVFSDLGVSWRFPIAAGTDAQFVDPFLISSQSQWRLSSCNPLQVGPTITPPKILSLPMPERRLRTRPSRPDFTAPSTEAVRRQSLRVLETAIPTSSSRRILSDAVAKLGPTTRKIWN